MTWTSGYRDEGHMRAWDRRDRLSDFAPSTEAHPTPRRDISAASSEPVPVEPAPLRRSRRYAAAEIDERQERKARADLERGIRSRGITSTPVHKEQQP